MGRDESLGEATLVLTAEDTDYNLSIDKAQEKAKMMDQVFDRTHEAIKSRFSERFEHAGLFMFSRQLLGTVGLADVARHAMGAIMASFEAVAASVGTTTAALGPWLLAAGVAIMIYEKLAHGADEYGDALKRMREEQEKSVPGVNLAATEAKVHADEKLLAIAKENQRAAESYMKNLEPGSIMYEHYEKAANKAATEVGTLTRAINEQELAMRDLKNTISSAAPAAAMNLALEREQRKQDANDALASYHKMRVDYAIMMDERAKKAAATAKKEEDAAHKAYASVGKAAVETAGKIQNAFNMAIARVIVEHRKMSEVIKMAEQQIAVDAISGALKIAENYAISAGKEILIEAGILKAKTATGAAAVAVTKSQTEAVGELGIALVAATKAAIALDAALAGAA